MQKKIIERAGGITFEVSISLGWDNMKPLLAIDIQGGRGKIRFECRSRADLAKALILLSEGNNPALFHACRENLVLYSAEYRDKKIAGQSVEYDIPTWNFFLDEFKELELFGMIRVLGWHELLPEG